MNVKNLIKFLPIYKINNQFDKPLSRPVPRSGILVSCCRRDVIIFMISLGQFLHIDLSISKKGWNQILTQINNTYSKTW